MNIFIVTLGTRGDVQPYVALGKALNAASHTVTICTSSSFESFITEHGLRYGYMNNGLVDLMGSGDARNALDNVSNPWEWIKTARRLAKLAEPVQRSILSDSWQSAQEANPDLVIFHPKAFGGPHFAEKLGIPVMMALPVPMLTPTAEFPAIGFPNWPLGPWYNRLTYNLNVRATGWATNKYVKEWRKSNGLPYRRRSASFLHDSAGNPIPVLYGFSHHVVPRPADWPEQAKATGYWFLDRLDAWQPPGRLEEFLEAGEPPVYVGFGSMAGRNPQKVTRVVVEALLQTHTRGIVASGWGGLETGALPDTILQIDQAPHDWLFPRVAAVVHHGGAGTTAAGIAAGKPTVICPFFGDQPFWARCVRDLYVGSEPIPQKQLTSERLANAIIRVTTDRGIKKNAELLGSKIRTENGPANAAAVVEKMMRTK